MQAGLTAIRGYEFWATLSGSFILALLLDDHALAAASSAVGSAETQVGTAFLGVVLAGLAIFIVFLDDKYVELLERVPPGVQADLAPFKYVAVTAALSAVAGVAYMLVGALSLPSGAVRVAFGLSLFLFTYLLWVTVDLVTFLLGHANVRIAQVRKLQRDAAAEHVDNAKPPSAPPGF